MRNADTPAAPVHDPDAPASEFHWTCGFTKYERVLLEFAKELTNHYSRMCMEGAVSHSGSYHEIMDEAASMTEAYFEQLEKQQ